MPSFSCSLFSSSQNRNRNAGYSIQHPDLVLRLLLLLFGSVTSGGAWGQTVGESEDNTYSDMSLKELMNIEVFSAASLIPTESAKAPGTAYSFDRKDFVRLGVRRLDDLLAYVPGLQLSQHRKRHRSIWARGQLDRYNDKMVLMVDGVRRQHAYYGHFSLGDNFPLEKIEKVEIILGPASSLYGANAFGGIISVTTRGFSKSSHIEAGAEGASNDRGKGTLLYNSSNLQAFGSYLEQDAPFRKDRSSFIGGQTLQPLDEDYGNLFVKANPFEGLTLSLDYYRNNTPFLFIPDTQDAFIREDSLTLSALYETGDLDRGKLQANFFYTWDNAREYEIVTRTGTLGYQEHQNAAMAGGTLTGFKRLFDEHVLALGFNWMNTRAVDMNFTRQFRFDQGFLSTPETGSLLSDPNVNNNDYAVFLQEVWTINSQFELTLGARYDKFQQFGENLNYRGALVFTPDSQQTWKLLYGTGIRTPTFREYLKVLENTNFVAPIPNPERIRSLELSYLYQWERANWNVTLFQNKVDDYIHEIPTPDGADGYYANSQSPWRQRGVETLLQYRPLNDLDLRLSAAYLHAEDLSRGKLPYLSTWSGSFTVNYNYFQDHRLGVSLFYGSRRPDTNKFIDDNPGAFLLTNLFGSGSLGHHFSYSVGVDNLFDIKLFDPAGDFGKEHNTERSSREIWGRIQWSFDP